MRPTKIAYFLVGLFVVAALVGLVTLLAVLGGRGAETDEYHAFYDNVAGLKFGTPVFFEGFQAGQIELIRPVVIDGRTRFRVDVSVLTELHIPDDSRMEIIQPNLLSGRALSIEAGRSESFVDPGGLIPAGETAGLAALPELVGGGEALIIDARQLMVEATAAMAQINRFVTDDLGDAAERYQSLPTTVESEVQTISADLRETIAGANAVVARLDSFLSENNAESVERTLANVETLSGNLAEASVNLATIGANVEVITGQVKTLIADNETDIEGSIVDLRYTMETIAERIDAMTYNLEGTSRNLYEFSRQIRLNPGLLLGGTAQTETSEAGAKQ